MKRLRRVALGLFAATLLASGSVVTAFAAAPPITTACRISGNGSLIYPILVPTAVWNAVLYPNVDRNGFLTAGAGCTT